MVHWSCGVSSSWRKPANSVLKYLSGDMSSEHLIVTGKPGSPGFT